MTSIWRQRVKKVITLQYILTTHNHKYWLYRFSFLRIGLIVQLVITIQLHVVYTVFDLLSFPFAVSM